MPDSMNFNDPNAMNQQGMPMQGWDPNQYPPQMQDGGYMQDPQGMQAQAMYGSQMGGNQGYSGYQDQMATQGYADPNAQYMQQSGMYYPEEASMYGAYGYHEEEPDRMARQQQVRAASNFGLKSHGAQQPQAAEYATTGAGMPVSSGMGMGQPAQQSDMAPQMAQPQAQPQHVQPSMVPSVDAQPKHQQPASQPVQQAYQQPQMPQQAAPMPYMGEPPKDSNAVLALILGILSIVFAILPPIGIVLGFFSCRFSKKFQKAGGDTGVGDSARIFGRVGFIFSIVMFFVFAFVIAYVAGASFGNYGARAIAIYFNNSPLGQIFGIIPLAS